MLEIASVVHEFDGQQVLGPVSYQFERGEQVALLGESGSGKTTLLNIMGCLLSPTKGVVKLAGHVVAGESDQHLSHTRLHRVGFVHQFFDLISDLSVIENVLVPLWLAKVPSPEKKAEELLDKVGLAALAQRSIQKLSGGQRQRVAIARALALDPPVILADEPTGSLDRRTGQIVIDLLVDVAQANAATLIVATHSDMVASHFSKHVLMEDGALRVAHARG